MTRWLKYTKTIFFKVMNKFIFAKIIEKYGKSHEKLNINGENKKALLLCRVNKQVQN
jgi:monomeric isocitrate dehydrogenase